ncbi:MAG: histidine kinase [Cytophagales bacterium]|nr:histidine kinase [Cytophagales bacterium]
MENSSSLEMYIILVGGTLAFLLLAGGIVFFILNYKKKILENEAIHQKDLLKRNLEATEIERRRVARELHDEVGSSLSMMRLLSASEGNGDLKLLIDSTIDNVKRISNDLLPNGLEEFGLEQSLEILVDKTMQASPINIEFQYSEFPELSSKRNLTVYRIVQELINNTLKHAKSERIVLILKGDLQKAIILYQDFGIGFDLPSSQRKDSLGLKNLMARSQYLGGKVKIETEPGQGLEVSIEFPVNHEED